MVPSISPEWSRPFGDLWCEDITTGLWAHGLGPTCSGHDCPQPQSRLVQSLPHEDAGSQASWLASFAGSNPAHQQEHQQYNDQNAKNTGWSVSPPSAVAPTRKCSNKNEDKDYEQYGSDRHFRSPSVEIIRKL